MNIVSIILPTYNGAQRIAGAIESVLRQSYASWELLVLDDGSTDGTEELITGLAENDQRIRYIKNETNLGIQKTLNKGIREAKGKYIARIDDDDAWIDADKLARQVEFLDEHHECVLIGTGLIAVDEKNKELFRHLPPITDEEIRQKMLARNCFTHSSVLFDKEKALACGGYPEGEDTKHIEDYALWLKLGTVGKLANLPIYAVRCTLRNESLSSKNRVVQYKKAFTVISGFKNKYPNYLSARLRAWVVMMLYRLLTMPLLRPLFALVYKLYKNI